MSDDLTNAVIAKRIHRMLKHDLTEVERAIESNKQRYADLMDEKYSIYKALKEAEHLVKKAGDDFKEVERKSDNS